MAVKKIILKGEDLCIRKEAIAAEIVSPGHFIEILAGEVALIAAVTAGLVHQVAFVYENEVVGDGIGDDYAVGDTCLYAICPRGVEVYALADAAVTVDGLVEATVTGEVSPISTGVAIGIALETIGSSGRLKIEVL